MGGCVHKKDRERERGKESLVSRKLTKHLCVVDMIGSKSRLVVRARSVSLVLLRVRSLSTSLSCACALSLALLVHALSLSLSLPCTSALSLSISLIRPRALDILFCHAKQYFYFVSLCLSLSFSFSFSFSFSSPSPLPLAQSPSPPSPPFSCPVSLPPPSLLHLLLLRRPLSNVQTHTHTHTPYYKHCSLGQCSVKHVVVYTYKNVVIIDILRLPSFLSHTQNHTYKICLCNRQCFTTKSTRLKSARSRVTSGLSTPLPLIPMVALSQQVCTNARIYTHIHVHIHTHTHTHARTHTDDFPLLSLLRQVARTDMFAFATLTLNTSHTTSKTFLPGSSSTLDMIRIHLSKVDGGGEGLSFYDMRILCVIRVYMYIHLCLRDCGGMCGLAALVRCGGPCAVWYDVQSEEVSCSYVSNEDVSCNPLKGAPTPKAITVSSANIRDAGAKREREGERNVLPARALQKVVSSVMVLIDSLQRPKEETWTCLQQSLNLTPVRSFHATTLFLVFISPSLLCLPSSLPLPLHPPSSLPLSFSLSISLTDPFNRMQHMLIQLIVFVIFPREGRLWNFGGTRKSTQTVSFGKRQRGEGACTSILMDIRN